MKLLIQNGRIIDPVTGMDTVSDILIVDGRIETIAPGISAPKGCELVEMKNRIVAPGFLDMHVHLREPGFEHKETIESGCAAAAAGGFTAVCCMPNTQPAIDDASVVRMIIARSKAVHGGIVDVYPVGAVTKGREGKELAPMLELAEAGAVAFSDDGAPVADAELMRRALEYSGITGRPVIQHAEDVALTKGGAMHEGDVSTALGLPPMPGVAEETIVARDLLLAGFVGSRYHVAHLSTGGAVALVRRAKQQGLRATCEVTPHHFTLTDEAVRGYDTNTKMNPPLRGRQDVEAILEGLRDGTVDVIATDHAPHSFDEKQVEFAHAPFGIVGLETAVGLVITELVLPGILALEEAIRKLSTNPRAIVGLAPIRIAAGERACLTLIDPKFQWKVDVQAFRSKAKNTPFHGRMLTGKPVGIVNNSRFLLVP
jgi:dihydroorotase